MFLGKLTTPYKKVFNDAIHDTRPTSHRHCSKILHSEHAKELCAASWQTAPSCAGNQGGMSNTLQTAPTRIIARVHTGPQLHRLLFGTCQQHLTSGAPLHTGNGLLKNRLGWIWLQISIQLHKGFNGWGGIRSPCVHLWRQWLLFPRVLWIQSAAFHLHNPLQKACPHWTRQCASLPLQQDPKLSFSYSLKLNT